MWAGVFSGVDFGVAITAYADVSNDLLVVVFDREIAELLTDAEVGQFVMAAMSPDPLSPSAYASIDLNQIAFDYAWPVSMPVSITLGYTANDPGDVYLERGLVAVPGFSVDVQIEMPPEPVPDPVFVVRSRVRARIRGAMP